MWAELLAIHQVFADPELLVAVITVPALLAATSYNWWQAIASLRALGGHANGRRMIARADVRRQSVKLAAFSLWLVPVSLIAFEIMPPSELRGNIVTWSLLLGMVALAVNAQLDIRDNNKLIADYMEAKRQVASSVERSDVAG